MEESPSRDERFSEILALEADGFISEEEMEAWTQRLIDEDCEEAQSCRG